MTKKIVKVRKLKVLHFLIFLLVIAIFILFLYLILNTKIKNIIIKNNNFLTDEEIITEAKLAEYPPFYLTNKNNILKKLKKNPLIKNVVITKKFYHVLEIKIEESKPLFYNEVNKKVVLDNKNEIDSNISFRIPRVMNYIPNTKYSSLIKNMSKVDEDILGKISEITYVPNDYDKDRFLLYMDDDNSVYLTLTKFKMINYYNKVVPQLEGKRGVLYLDSGNHFQVRE